MSERRMSRWMGPLGLGVLVLLGLGFAGLGGSHPGENASGAAVIANYNAHVAQQWAKAYVIGLGLAALVVYVSHLRGLLHGRNGSRTLANMSFAAGMSEPPQAARAVVRSASGWRRLAPSCPQQWRCVP